jgi:hypothetical protein
MELNPLTTDSSIFYKNRKNIVKSILYIESELIISVHIDDFLMVDQISVLEEFKAKIAVQFIIKFLNMAFDYLDIQINRLESFGAIKLHQTAYFKNLIKRYEFEKLNPRRISLQNQLNIEFYDFPFLDEKVKNRYQFYVGSFIYVMMDSRLDLIFSVFFISRFMAKSNEFYDKLIKEIFRYIKNSLLRDIIYRKRHQNKNLTFTASIDSDWAGSSILGDGRSILRYSFFLFRGFILWLFKRQSTIATFSTEAEYIG